MVQLKLLETSCLFIAGMGAAGRLRLLSVIRALGTLPALGFYIT
jgi:hypothetical protein